MDTAQECAAKYGGYMTSKQPEALRLAELIEQGRGNDVFYANEAAAELRRLHEENKQWQDKCQAYIELHDAVVKDSDRAYELLRRCENEMRYAGWTKFEPDNPARNGVYEQVKEFLK